MTDATDVVWVSAHASSLTPKRYHTDADCPYLHKSGDSPTAKSLSLIDSHFEQCQWCAGEMDSKEGSDPRKYTSILASADPDDIGRPMTDGGEDRVPVCPECGSVSVREKLGDPRNDPRKSAEDWYCHKCNAHFQRPDEQPRSETDARPHNPGSSDLVQRLLDADPDEVGDDERELVTDGGEQTVVCYGCGAYVPRRQTEDIDVSPPDEYYPDMRALCPDCSGDSEDDAELVTDGGERDSLPLEEFSHTTAPEWALIIADELDLNRTATSKARQFARDHGLNGDTSRRPRSVASGAVYLAAALHNDKRNQAEVAEVADVSTVTVATCYQEIAEAEGLISDHSPDSEVRTDGGQDLAESPTLSVTFTQTFSVQPPAGISDPDLLRDWFFNHYREMGRDMIDVRDPESFHVDVVDEDVDRGEGIETDGGQEMVLVVEGVGTYNHKTFHTDADCYQIARAAGEPVEKPLRVLNDSYQECRFCAGTADPSHPEEYDPNEYKRILVDADPDEVGRPMTDGGTDTARQTNWEPTDPVQKDCYLPLDMARNIEDRRTRDRIAWVDGFGRAYCYALDHDHDHRELVTDGGFRPPRGGVEVPEVDPADRCIECGDASIDRCGCCGYPLCGRHNEVGGGFCSAFEGIGNVPVCIRDESVVSNSRIVGTADVISVVVDDDGWHLPAVDDKLGHDIDISRDALCMTKGPKMAPKPAIREHDLCERCAGIARTLADERAEARAQEIDSDCEEGDVVTDGGTQQTKTRATNPQTAILGAIDVHYDDEQCGAPVGDVIEAVLTDPTIHLHDAAMALRDLCVLGRVYQPSDRTVARVSTDGGKEMQRDPPADRFDGRSEFDRKVSTLAAGAPDRPSERIRQQTRESEETSVRVDLGTLDDVDDILTALAVADDVRPPTEVEFHERGSVSLHWEVQDR